MATAKLWTREELLIAFTLYSQIPFGKLHSKNPEIIYYAKL
ncbi:HNH endonuclease, partial [Serratia marcescens]